MATGPKIWWSLAGTDYVIPGRESGGDAFAPERSLTATSGPAHLTLVTDHGVTRRRLRWLAFAWSTSSI